MECKLVTPQKLDSPAGHVKVANVALGLLGILDNLDRRGKGLLILQDIKHGYDQDGWEGLLRATRLLERQGKVISARFKRGNSRAFKYSLLEVCGELAGKTVVSKPQHREDLAEFILAELGRNGTLADTGKRFSFRHNITNFISDKELLEMVIKGQRDDVQKETESAAMLRGDLSGKGFVVLKYSIGEDKRLIMAARALKMRGGVSVIAFAPSGEPQAVSSNSLWIAKKYREHADEVIVYKPEAREAVEGILAQKLGMDDATTDETRRTYSELLLHTDFLRRMIPKDEKLREMLRSRC